MSRRKQSNPKPFLKSELAEGTSEMTNVKDDEKKLEETLTDISKDVDGNVSISNKDETKNENEETIVIKEETNDDVGESEIVPKLRLNMLLASDPALKPDAKDLKYLHEQSKKIDKLLIKSDIADNVNKDLKHKSTLGIGCSSRMKVFMCVPCGIGFSSHSTLEAHQAYYCSHRPDVEEESQINVNNFTDKEGEPSTKVIKTGKLYACLHCSYSADKKVSLNRHMRMHQSSPTTSSNASNEDDNSSQQQIDRYCTECDIKFSSAKTYRAHKQHYCSSRRADESTTPKSEFKQTESISPLRSSNSPVSSKLAQQPFLALPTNPIIVIPYTLIKAASIFSGPLSTQPSSDICYSLENGSLKPIATVLSTENASECSISNTGSHVNLFDSDELVSDRRSRNLNEELTRKLKKDGFNRDIIPLDLSVRPSGSKFHHQVFLEGKENVSVKHTSLTPDHIICTPSLPNSPSHTPSPKRKVLSPHDSHNSLRSQDDNSNISLKLLESSNIFPTNIMSKQNLEIALNKISQSPNNSTNIPDVALNAANNLSLPAMTVISNSTASHTVLPQAFIKQGVSKCKECNIVFCKYENYLAHKQHYCSSRIQDELVENKISISQTPNAEQQPTVSYHQLICAACGIKYTSLDNLRAHQSYYCPKGGTINKPSEINQLIKGEDKKNLEDERSLIDYKCPICEVVSVTANENRKHLESHTNVKIYRCTICRYKGNTFRGMRSHIRMHFENKTNEFTEETYMSIVLQENGIEFSTSAVAEEITAQQLYNCELCEYSSYKTNVIRHIKTQHSHQELVNSPELKESESDKLLNGEINFTKLKDIESDSSSPTIIPKIEDDDIEELDVIGKQNNSSVLSSLSPVADEDIILPTTTSNADQKYCQTCDIKFNYMKTYIAHKQFYCKNKKNEETSPVSVYNKSKESLET